MYSARATSKPRSPRARSDAEAADAPYATHAAATRSTPAVDEENFRLVNRLQRHLRHHRRGPDACWSADRSSIGGDRGADAFDAPAPLSRSRSLVAGAASGGMAEFFTRQRRMALPEHRCCCSRSSAACSPGWSRLAEVLTSDIWRNETL